VFEFEKSLKIEFLSNANQSAFSVMEKQLVGLYEKKIQLILFFNFGYPLEKYRSLKIVS